VSRPASFPIVLSDSQQGKNISSDAPDEEGAYSDHMPSIEKEAKKVLKKAEGSSKKGSSSKTDSKKGKGSGADKAKRAARELLK
jgi:hypothetical protein